MSGARQLTGDLDNIVRKATAKAPAERYGSVRELAADIANYLAGRPVSAVKPSPWYSTRKWIARNRWTAGLGTAAALTLIASTAYAIYQARRAEEQRLKAEQRFAAVREITNKILFDYQYEIMNLSASPQLISRMNRDSVKLLDVLATQGAQDTKHKIEVAQGYRQLASALGNPRASAVGDEDGARLNLEKALRILATIAESDQLAYYARSERALCNCQLSQLQADPPRMQALAESCHADAEGVLLGHPNDFQIVFRAIHANLRMAELQISSKYGLRAIELTKRYPPQHRMNALVLAAYARRLTSWRYLAEGNTEGAYALAQQALANDEERAAAGITVDYPLSLDHGVLASVQFERGHHRESLRHAFEAVRLRRKALTVAKGDFNVQHRLFLGLVQLGRTYEALGQQADAQRTYEQAIQESATRLKPDHPDWPHLLAALHGSLGFLLRKQKRPEACEALRRAHEFNSKARKDGELTLFKQLDQQLMTVPALCGPASTDARSN